MGSKITGPFPFNTSNSIPIAVSGVNMSLNMMTPSDDILFFEPKQNKKDKLQGFQVFKKQKKTKKI
jgi:hypothetical protein